MDNQVSPSFRTQNTSRARARRTAAALNDHPRPSMTSPKSRAKPVPHVLTALHGGLDGFPGYRPFPLVG
jgi:hypothetical protein